MVSRLNCKNLRIKILPFRIKIIIQMVANKLHIAQEFKILMEKKRPVAHR